MFTTSLLECESRKNRDEPDALPRGVSEGGELEEARDEGVMREMWGSDEGDAVFGAPRSSDGALTVMVVNKALTAASALTFILANFAISAGAAAQVGGTCVRVWL